MAITIEILEGEDSKDYLDIVSGLRIEIFAEYPYLYKGSFEYEKHYMQGFTADKRAMIAVAKVDGELAGISTGIPLASDSDIVREAQQAFIQEDTQLNDYYYYGEIIVLPKFRSQGLATQLFNAQDRKVKEWGFKHVCILTVVREEDHPLKPEGYKSSDSTWRRLGFDQLNRTMAYHWPTFQTDGSVKEVRNTMVFWKKPLVTADTDVLVPQADDQRMRV